jgi:hypothetical protein
MSPMVHSRDMFVKIDKKAIVGILITIFTLFYSILLLILHYSLLSIPLGLLRCLMVVILPIVLIVLLVLSKNKLILAVALGLNILILFSTSFLIGPIYEEKITPVILKKFYCNQKTAEAVKKSDKYTVLIGMPVFYISEGNRLVFEKAVCLTTVCKENAYVCEVD